MQVAAGPASIALAFRAKSDAELMRVVESGASMAYEDAAAMVEQARRRRRSDFWRKDIVSWSALRLSVAFIFMQL